jgi:hypothetical protein
MKNQGARNETPSSELLAAQFGEGRSKESLFPLFLAGNNLNARVAYR